MAASLRADFYVLKWNVVDSYATEKCPIHVDILLNENEIIEKHAQRKLIFPIHTN